MYFYRYWENDNYHEPFSGTHLNSIQSLKVFAVKKKLSAWTLSPSSHRPQSTAFFFILSAFVATSLKFLFTPVSAFPKYIISGGTTDVSSLSAVRTLRSWLTKKNQQQVLCWIFSCCFFRIWKAHWHIRQWNKAWNDLILASQPTYC